MVRITALLILVSCSTSFAQLKSQTEKPPIDVLNGITSTPNLGLFGNLFSPDRFHMSHSYGVTFYSGGGQSGSIGLYTNTMDFRLSNPLFLRVNTGVLHRPFGGPRNAPDNAQLVHGAELIYKPTKNFQLNVGYSSTPLYGGYRPYESPFARHGSDVFEGYTFGRQ